jgi:hypothetical protein
MVAILNNLWTLVSDPFKSEGTATAVLGSGFLVLVIILLCVVTPIVGVISTAVSTHTFDDGTGSSGASASGGGCGGGSSMPQSGYQYNPSVNPSGSPALLPALTAATVGDFQGGLAGFAGTRNMKGRAYGLTTAGTSSFSASKLVGLAANN